MNPPPAVEKRRFMRHPTEIPIEVCRTQEVLPRQARQTRQARDVGAGGLSFICSINWHPGTSLRIRLPLIKPVFETIGKVVWCRKRGHYYEVGVAFKESDDAFTLRMVEQLCQIEMYRKRQEGRGRELTSEQAAMEWINLYAEEFSDKADHWSERLH